MAELLARKLGGLLFVFGVTHLAVLYVLFRIPRSAPSTASARPPVQAQLRLSLPGAASALAASAATSSASPAK